MIKYFQTPYFFMEYVFRLEILEDLPDVDTIFVSVGGGGLISGIAAYVKAIKPSVKVLKITKTFLVFLLFLFGQQKHTLIVSLAHIPSQRTSHRFIQL